MSDYSKGKIYKIECKITNEVYYGSTVQSLSERIRHHKCVRDCTSINIIDRGNYTINVIEEFPCDSKQELEAREGYYIRNNVCVNERIPGRTKEEYREDNIEWYKQYYKQYREKNIDKIKEYDKKRHEQRKDKIKAHNSTKVKCECGCEVTRGVLTRHKKSKKHADLLGHQSLGNN